jgi:hypothetical protein
MPLALALHSALFSQSTKGSSDDMASTIIAASSSQCCFHFATFQFQSELSILAETYCQSVLVGMIALSEN